MIFSKEAAYAVRVLVKLASFRNKDYVSVAYLANQLSIPNPFLSKIIQKLVNFGWLESKRGNKGGVRFSVNPQDVTIMDVLIKIDGPDTLETCILGLSECNDKVGCPIHQYWLPLKKKMLNILESQTIASLAAFYKNGKEEK